MNIRIRKMTVSDLEPLYKLLSNSKVMQYLEAPYVVAYMLCAYML